MRRRLSKLPADVWRGIVLLGLLGPAIALGGCGGGHQAAPPRPKRPVAPPQAPQLIAMRRIDGATYQTVVIRTDGTGDVGEFIGERTGVVHRRFRIDRQELAHLRQLARVAARVPAAVYFGTPPPSVVFILFDQDHVLQVAKGHMPRRLASLTGILNRLIDRYA